MLSILIPARSGQQFTANCLASVRLTVQALNLTPHVEYVLIDDASDPVHCIPEVFAEFAEDCGSPCKMERLKEWGHYTGSFARAMELADLGNHLFLLSNDMVITPAFLSTALAVSALDPAIGIVRGRSRHCDSMGHYNIETPIAPKRWEDVASFSRCVSEHHGLAYQEDGYLSGDAVLIKRDVVEKIGIFDRRFFGYFADPDYGIRTRRAGFKLVCALGAWLQHAGGGHIVDEANQKGVKPIELLPERMRLVEVDYQKFRAKYGIESPATYDRDKKMAEFLDWDKLCESHT